MPSAFHLFNGDLYFNGLSNALSNDTLFQLDTAGNLTALSFHGEALQEAGALGGFADFAGSTYFVAATTTDGPQLFKLDTAGTISEIAPNSERHFIRRQHFGGFVQFDDSLYFDAYDFQRRRRPVQARCKRHPGRGLHHPRHDRRDQSDDL